ncbi:LOW QUALITY PROTEIN: integrin alpha-PS3 [Drosophila rhopaloa]|uniref:Integrin alpha second immunoglobulin-like domain-containing protein n=1 Tax=Drosophila rhopaloa TaxID=1041015 RepID=A0ABM5HAR1_DRORH|nr:LOW QUALITY PROTEIN: integrin alpha-PS3 [Drosophila rhopaloa]
MCLIVCLVLLILKCQIEAFNLSPYANLVINLPKQPETHLKPTRSSYFGYTLVIRPTSIFVGAPRAQSTLDSQSTINETGAIYRCSLTDGDCIPYVLDARGDVDAPDNGYTWNSESKDYQWLGGSMDGGTRDTDKLLVCAPRFYTPNRKGNQLHGACYWVSDTVSPTPQHVMRTSPLRLKSQQRADDGTSFFFMGELGQSTHVTDDNSEFLIGAPGIDDWKGSVVLYRKNHPVALRRLMRDVDTTNYKPDNYSPKILLPSRWGQKANSYFGYAISSGYFDSANLSNLLYVATAPQASEAFIFSDQGTGIRKFYEFHGEQLGEYFGYSILAEDLNGDGKTDVIISAPLNALGDSPDVGAIYVFINKGLFSFEQKILRSSVSSKARFGTTLSRLGDINNDGYNDVAVGAPFEGNGAVFIYLGSEDGLRDQPSQRLDSPPQQTSQYGAHMFGHGLSRGSDFDGNGYNDFAIGAPNAEAVYLYSAYPVVKIQATVKSESREIKPEQEKFKITACYQLNFIAEKKEVQEQMIDIRITIDEQLKRFKFALNQDIEMSFNAKAGPLENCPIFDVQVNNGDKDIFEPIVLKIHYGLAQTVPKSGGFCETCAVVDPADPKVYTEKISFCTGCAADVCVADLQLKSIDVIPNYILGSTDILRLKYEVTSEGENAYVPQLNVTSSARLPFAQVPGNCKVTKAVMLCDLNHGRKLAKGDSDSITITFDVSQLSGDSLIIDAAVFSAGSEKNPTDNKQSNVISLREFTEIDASGGSANGQVVLNSYPYSAEIINNYEFKSRGPSIIDQLTLVFHIPIAYKYKVAGSSKIIPIINITSLDMDATYDSHLLTMKLYDHKGLPVEYYTQIGLDDDQATTNQGQNVGSHDLQSEDFKEELPVNRTIVFNCRDTNMTICVHAEMTVKFRPDKPINVNISFNVDLRDMKQPWEYFVIHTDVDLVKEGDPTSKTLGIKRKFEPNVIFKNLNPGMPIWYIILSLIGGILLLSGLTYVLYKLGFFKRFKREELNRLRTAEKFEHLLDPVPDYD